MVRKGKTQTARKRPAAAICDSGRDRESRETSQCEQQNPNKSNEEVVVNAIPDDCRLPREVPLLSSFPVHVVPLPVNPDKAKEDLWNIDMYLTTLVSDMVSRLSDGCRKALWEYLSAQSFSLASLCAGSDSPRLVFEAISSVAADSGISTSMKHALSAELNAQKRHFLRTVFPDGSPLFGDLHSLLEEVADDYGYGEAQEEIKKTRPPDFNTLIAGFPCQSVSRLNNMRKESLDAVRSKKGKTGNAWAGIKNILRMARRQGRTISFAVFENVLGLGSPNPARAVQGEGQPNGILSSNLAACMADLHEEHFFSCAVQLDPRSFGHPVSRPRYYILAFNYAVMEKYGMTETSVYSLVKEHMELFSGHGVVPIERLLLPETSGPIQDMLKDLVKKPVEEPGLGSTGLEPPVEAEASGQSEKSGKKGETKWQQTHLDHALSKGLAWWKPSPITDELRKKFPGINQLGPRALDILQLNGIGFPESECRMVEVSQSMGRQSKMVDTMPCLTPKMQRWVTSRCRLVHGVESMMFQGLAYKSCSNLGEKFSSDLLCDIAGNAFHAGCASAATMTVLCTLARGAACHQQAVLERQAVARPSSDASDSDGNESVDLSNIF